MNEFGAVALARKEGGDELSQKMVARLLDLMDIVNRTEGVLSLQPVTGLKLLILQLDALEDLTKKLKQDILFVFLIGWTIRCRDTTENLAWFKSI